MKKLMMDFDEHNHRRIQQVREAQEWVAGHFQARILDFGKLFRGFEEFQEKVHPNRDPGCIISQAYLYYLSLLSSQQW